MRIGLLLACVPLYAHDLWIEPATFSPQPGQIVSLRLKVGQDFIGDPVPRDPSLVKEFVVQDGARLLPVPGRAGMDPAGFLRVEQAGLRVIGYHSNPSRVEMDAAKFNAYLKEEGLEAIAAQRAQRKQSNTGVRELFARCAKSLLLTGTPSLTQADRALGFPLELVAEKNPYTGRDVPLRLTYQGKPLAGALVVAMNRWRPEEKISHRSGADGRVRFVLPADGQWMIKAVHMVEAPAGADADWLSYWASLTFESPKAVKP